MTIQHIHDYFDLVLQEVCIHDPEMLLEASHETGGTFELDPYDVLCFMCENKPLHGTHSYGFLTPYGRAIREHFSSIYHYNPKPDTDV
jgi:hypothetical protein|tara:strand:+ start:216 stop:479 length:264 start_codon:yes stop_codon:yes gene_type:complete